MTFSRFVNSIKGSIVYALVASTAILAGCQSAGRYPEGSLAAIQEDHRRKIFHNCVTAVYRRSPLNPYVDPLTVIDGCSRLARKRIPR